MGPFLPASSRAWSPESPGRACPEPGVSAPTTRRLPALRLTLAEAASLSPLETLVASASNWNLIQRMGVREQFATLARAPRPRS